MIDWDSVPFAAQPTQPALGAQFSYVPAAGRVGRLYGFSLHLQTAGALPAARAVHIECGNTFYPYDLDNYFGSIGGVGHLGEAGTLLLIPGITQYVANFATYQCAPLNERCIITNDLTYHIATACPLLGVTDQFTVKWRYKEVSV